VGYEPAHRQLSADGTELLVTLPNSGTAAGSPLVLSLRRDDPAARRFQVPRVTRDGGRDLEYSYSIPVAGNDWPVASLGDEHIDRTTIYRMVASILRQQSAPPFNRTDSVLIARNGRLVLEEYFWGYGPNIPHAISSDTKSLTSLIVGIAVDRRKLRLQDRIGPYFPEYAKSEWIRNDYPIAIRDMLSMQANLQWNEDVPYQDARNTAIGLVLAKDPIEFVLSRPLAGPPGVKFQYNSGLPNLLGDLVTRAVGRPIEDFADEFLFSRLGIKNYRWTRLANGHAMASGGMVMLPRDMAKIGQLMLNGGMWKGQRIVSRAWVDASTTQQTGPDDYAYGFYWHLCNERQWQLRGHLGFMAGGQAGQFIVVVPALSLVVVVTSSNWQPGGTKIAFDEIVGKFVMPAVHTK